MGDSGEILASIIEALYKCNKEKLLLLSTVPRQLHKYTHMKERPKEFIIHFD